MPSSSKKQHNFMAAIAHSPSFAKKAGVPQSVGKDFTAADKGRKFNSGGVSMNPRARKSGGKIRRFADGGDTSYDDMSFGQAWRAARADKGAGDTFTYKGKEYSTNTKEEGVGTRRAIPSDTVDTSERGPSRGALGKSRESKTDDTPFLSRGKDQAAGAALSRSPKLSSPKDEPLEESHPEDLLGIGKAVVGLGTAAALGRRALPKILSKMGKVGAGVEERAAAKAAEEAAANSSSRLARLRKPLEEASAKAKEAQKTYRGSGFRQPTDIKVGDDAAEVADRLRAARLARYEQDSSEAYRGMKKGGKVTKKYAAGGSVRGDGCATKGKTKGKFR